MKRILRAPARCALALAVSMAVAAPGALAAGLGRISVKSALGQPLRAEVEVTSISREEAASLAVRLATAAAYRQANLELNPALTGLRVTLDRRGDAAYVVQLESASSVSEPYLDLLLELTSNSGRVLREYTVLLDPPALRTQPEVVAPVASRTRPAAAPAPASAPAAAAASAPAPGRAATADGAGGSTYSVRRGDTLGSIAERTRPSAASLDQMLVALFRANPQAFQENNMNLVRAGSTLKVPEAGEVTSIDAAAARREVATQSADFARYRSRLAQAAGAAAPVGGAGVGRGQVMAKVEDKSAAAPSGDQLKIGQAPPTSTATDESVARERQIRELQARVEELERTNAQLQRAIELQSKSGAQAQAAAEAKTGGAAPAPAAPPVAAAPAPAPVPAPAASAPAPAEPPKAAAPTPPPAAAAPPPPAAPPSPPPVKAAPAPEPEPEPGLLSGLLAGPTMPIVAGLGAILLGLIGYTVYKRRKEAEGGEQFDAAADAARGNSLFGQTGGRSVDTGAASSFNSSFMPQASQIDSTEVDPVAEADVYIAYGREEQAEDILKEALRLQPDRHSARVKLMEIVARRGDRPTFLEMARELKERTGASGEDWERAVALGRSIDPSNALFAGAPGVEVTSRGPTTEMRFGPTTRGAAADSGYRAPPATLGGDSVLDFSTTPLTVPAERKVSAKDSVMSVDSKLGVETQLPIDPATNAIAPTTQGHPTESGRPTEVGDLSTLEFEALNTMPATQALDEERAAEPAEPEALNIDLGPSPAAPRMQPMPDLDLSLPPLSAPAPAALPPSRPVLAPEPEPLAAEHQYLGGFDFAPTKDSPVREPMTTSAFNNSVTGRRTVPPPLEDALSRPSLLGDLGALPEEGTTRLASNTDQATVPLIDFDLTGADAPLTGTGRGATPTGSPMASQMATKLDLARGYIDLGVKDGARELLEEVMRDGTREQRQHAVELLKQVER